MTAHPRSSRWLGAAALAVLLSFSCTDSYLYDPKVEDQIPADRTMAVAGDFCTPPSNAVVRPIKILLVMDASQSMSVNDPDGTRAQAMIDLMSTLPDDPEIYISILLFAGSTSAWLTSDNTPRFDELDMLSSTYRTLLAQRLLNFTVPGNMTNRDSTDFVKPLSDVYALVTRDIADTRIAAQMSGKGGETLARYTVIFLSDGEPTKNQDDQLLCGDAVTRIRDLKDLAEDVTFNTCHVFEPTAPIASTKCDLDGGTINSVANQMNCRPFATLPPGQCPLFQVNQDAARLERMAELGGGEFRDFRNNEPINFLNFNFGQVRRTYEFDKLVVANFSAPPDSPPDAGDTDSDGLLDAEEIDAGTIPWVVDTDGDGFSDGVEVHFSTLGAAFNPLNVMLPDGGGLDPGCPPELRGVDSDCDGLLDCDEQIIGTNSLRVDTDDDGIPDAVEWKLGGQPSGNDLAQDPDTDSLKNADEMLMHTDLKIADASKLSVTGYRYNVQKNGPVNDLGQQCFNFRVDNVLLEPTWEDTRDAGNPDGGAPLFAPRGAGYNDIYVSLSMKPGDDATGHTLMRQFRINTTRYPVGGIKLPSDGVVTVHDSDLVEQCGVTQTGP